MAETIKTQIQEKTISGFNVIHPETDSSVVKYDDTKNTDVSTGADNVQDAIDGIKSTINGITGGTGGVVTGVKGDAETNYRSGQVNITPEHIGAYSKHEIDVKQEALTTGITEATNKANEAKSIAEGRSKGESFETYNDLVNSLKQAPRDGYRIGDNLYIKATNVPDYWVSAVLDNNSGTTGYFEISVLEAQKVDLTDYQTKNDNSLSTTSKTVVGAINEVKETADNAKNGALFNSQEITAILDGSYSVGKATNSTKADSADKLSNSRKITLKGDATGDVSFDGSKDVDINVTLKESSVLPGTYSAISVNEKGIVDGGYVAIDIADSVNASAAANLVVGGLFFKRLE